MIFGFGKKELARKMIGGVDKIKIVLYKILLDSYKNSGEAEDRTGFLAAAAVNEIFDCHNELSRENFGKNKEVVVEGIKRLGDTHSELKQSITDAIRVYVQSEWMLSGKLEDDFQHVFNNAQERGIFIKGGEPPNPTVFLSMANELAEQYDLMNL